MRYGAAYLLAALSGSSPSAKEIEKILGSVGIDCDAAQAKIVVESLKGKVVDDVVAEGMEKIGGLLASGGGGGGGGAVAAAASGGGGGGAAAEAPKAEEKPAEPEEESDDDMGFGLFD